MGNAVQWGLISLEYSSSELGRAKPKVLSLCPFFLKRGLCAGVWVGIGVEVVGT